ncbi:hypothetical protein MMC34_006219 [Xylographa carneopallida]|nr:hypothetical protein [Xylographa carneopallida]
MDQNPAGAGQGQQRQPPPRYDPTNGGHYGASALLAAHGHAPGADLYQGTWANVNQGLHGTYRDILMTYWQQTIYNLENEVHDYKLHHLPLARIKKVMKADPEVKMISAEAPILFAKGCDIFITELTMRAWIHAEENKRRTLQRSDIASALAKSDMFDFLIDIVPREEAAGHPKRSGGQGSSNTTATQSASTGSNQIAPPHGNGQQQPHPHQPAPQQHHMAPPDYTLAHNSMPAEPDYGRQQSMYVPQGPPDPTHTYGQPQPQMFGQEMYGYSALPPQQVRLRPIQLLSVLTASQMYQVGQRGPDPSGGQDPGHHYQRHDGGEGDVDAEGERDYEVG